MSAAAKTGLPEYRGRDDKPVFVAKITDMTTDQESGCTVIEFGEIGKRTIAIPQWIAEFQPSIGGYFVVTDRGIRSHGSFMPADQFEKQYTPDEATVQRLEAFAALKGNRVE